jgi:type VI secretion system ImpC/EvpB family protein
MESQPIGTVSRESVEPPAVGAGAGAGFAGRIVGEASGRGRGAVPAGSLLARFLGAAGDEAAIAVWLGQWGPEAPPGRGVEMIRRMERDLAAIDRAIGEQVDAVLHDPAFQALEASWRGLRDLVGRVEARGHVKVKVLSVSWAELVRDLDRAIEFDQSILFRKVYTDEFDMPGGEPFSVLIGDYEIGLRPGRSRSTDDVEALGGIAQVAASAFAPFVAAAHPSLFGLDDFGGLERDLDLDRGFDQLAYLKWRRLRASEDARFVALTMPRVLRRAPYDERRVDCGFPYREDISGPGVGKYLWGTAVYAYAAVLVRAFAASGWLEDIGGVERGSAGGGLVDGLPSPSFGTDTPGVAPKFSTDVAIGEELDRELGAVGFLPLCDCPDAGISAFHQVGTIQRADAYDRPVATANARLSAQLPVVLNVSRFAHYIKVIAREKIGAFLEPQDLESLFRDWIVRYVSASEAVSPEIRARYPLLEARIQVRARADRPGSYYCVAHLRPRLQRDEGSASVRLTTDLPSEWRPRAAV